MDHDPKTRHELRCFCSRKPLLAMYGIDSVGQLYIHVKVYKQDRIYCEMVVREGKTSLKCRDCFRWYNVRMLTDSVKLEESVAPEEIIVPDAGMVGPDDVVLVAEVS